VSFYFPQACVRLRILPEDFQLVSDAAKQNPGEVIVIPKEITVSINDHKTSDSFSCELDYSTFPFDPRIVRYCGVVVYMGNVQTLYSGSQLNTIEPKESNAIFAGFVDEETITFDDTKRSVRFEGRDFTSLLIDQKYADNVPVFMNEPLDVQIKAYLQTFKATEKIKFDNRTGGTLPTIASFFPGFGSAPLAGAKNVGTHESYWEIIQDLVSRAGLICYMDIDTLVVTTPRNLYNPRADLKFVYGKNVKNLTFKRKLGRLKGFNIRVRSRVGKEVLTADIPREATPEWAKDYGIELKDAEVPVLKPDGTLDKTTNHKAPFITFPVSNIGNKDQLVKIGQSVYEDYSRQQLEGSFETMEMLAHSDEIPDFDLTDLNVGIPLAIEIDSSDLTQISRLATVEERTQYLLRRQYDKTLAHTLATTYGKFSPRFFTKAFSYTLNEQGFKLKIEFVNIIELTNRMFDGISGAGSGVVTGVITS
jgi:hypothetical protein